MHDELISRMNAQPLCIEYTQTRHEMFVGLLSGEIAVFNEQDADWSTVKVVPGLLANEQISINRDQFNQSNKNVFNGYFQ